jgi:hypothetical protein
MKTIFNFKSQICTSKVQSEALLKLGLKKETADMCSVIDHMSDGGKLEEIDTIFSFTPDDWNFRESVTPRWSLYRLIEMIDNECVIHLDNFTIAGRLFEVYDNLFDNIISCIEWLIKEGHFNKEYLV